MAVPLPHDNSEAVFGWFTEFQRSCILKNGIVPEWFHGIISRKAAEEMLMCKPPGYFLIRVGESRVGYTLSYRADDRCRHFMIDLLPDNQFVIVGETSAYRSLYDLVAFHRRNPIMPYNELLTVACEQGGKNDYVELLFPRKKDLHPDPSGFLNSFTQANVSPHSNISENNPTSAFQNESPTLPPSPTTRLYPSLETELTTLHLQSMEQQPKPVPKPRTIHTSITPIQDIPPPLPPRASLPRRPLTTVEEDRSDRQQMPPSTPCEDNGNNRTQQKHQQQPKPVISLAQIKKKFKKKRSQSQDHEYEEITENVCQEDDTFSTLENYNLNPQQVMENDYQELPENCPAVGHQTSDGTPKFVDSELPVEYLNPPPFAPGY
ncbi:hematopoietic SH2 domain-containing protein homolog [Myxocyprinus asiaticus]|uniref:hematopoietic SH2 domain-containing protein homolog n=1 Tax=Myxocyprinus asiaticus TaxID=70543 RepID=UPI00222187B1|nr:hematopoietic SH2 domain-containing protein homolog [Myxocyprinus asiaticus]